MVKKDFTDERVSKKQRKVDKARRKAQRESDKALKESKQATQAALDKHRLGWTTRDGKEL